MRPLIVMPARFSASASALRYAAEVTARALAEAVWRAGGEPFPMHPADPGEVAVRLARCDGVLLPGGGDLAPWRYGAAEAHDSVYDVDDVQDEFDLAVAAEALSAGVPLLAICRGMQVVNVALGGTLQQHMEADHRHVTQPVPVEPGSLLARTVGTAKMDISCYHHQRLADLGAGLAVTAEAGDGTVEAVERPDAPGWFLGVQWHPEDTAPTDPTQLALFTGLVGAAAHRARARDT